MGPVNIPPLLSALRPTLSLRSLSVVPVVLVASLSSCQCRQGVDDSQLADTQLAWEPAQTVVLITIDSLSPRILLGETWDWEVAPTLHGVFDESVLLPNVLTPAGVTRPALASVLTGLYPQQHGARTNSAELRAGTSLLRRFRDEGYTSYGFSSNQCPLIRDGDTDEYLCTWNDELTGTYNLEERDQLLVDGLIERLTLQPADDPMFLWLHVNNVHHPYMADRDLAEEYYGGAYMGFLNPGDDDMVADVTLGQIGYTADERRYLEANYAAQLTQTDAMIGDVLQTLRDLGRYDDAIIVLGADHGEELAERQDVDYFWHGCSPYNSVLRVVYSLRAPGRIQGGQVLDGWVSSTDLAPTIVELASSFRWAGEKAGSSLVPYLTGGAAPDAPVYSGRGTGTAVMIQQDFKYLLADAEEYSSCEPYSGSKQGYASRLEELYDLSVDGAEEIDLISSEPERVVAMHTTMCEWMVDVGWVSSEQADDNLLFSECEVWLCEVGSEYCTD